MSCWAPESDGPAKSNVKMQDPMIMLGESIRTNQNKKKSVLVAAFCGEAGKRFRRGHGDIDVLERVN